MKKLFSILALLSVFNTSVLAKDVSCGAIYALGLGHFLKGEVIPVGAKEEFYAGESVEDEWTKVETQIHDGKVEFKVYDKVAKRDIEIQSFNGTELQFSKVENVPVEVVPGFGKAVFLFLVCEE